METKQLNSDSTMQEVLEQYPGAQRALMRRYHIGGCQSCGFSPTETLGAVLARNQITETGEVIQHIQDAHEQELKLQITGQTLKAALATDNPPKLLDVRSQQERELVHIEGSIHATQSVAQEIMQSWAKDTPIVTYCHHGLRSLDATSYLIGHGFTNVKSLTGGIDAWATEVDPALPRY